jgi:acetoin utilization deacetylase AcuC-like enzyme
MKLFYSDVFELPLPVKHRFPMAKYRLLRERVQSSSLFDQKNVLPAPTCSDEQLCLVHDRDYVERVAHGKLSDLEIRRIGFPWSEKMVVRSRRSTGASVAAAQAALVEGVSANLAGGTHHAFPESGQGYCVFNDACVAARVVQTESDIGNILFIDCDVHQGNGTAAVAKNDPTLFAFSIHSQVNYPFRKTDGDLDVALPENTGDDNYLSALGSALNQIFDAFSPELVFYISGADPFVGDRLGKLNLTKAGLRRRDEIVLARCRSAGIPVAISMAGGYANDVQDIVDIHFQTLLVGLEHFNAKNNFAAQHQSTRP